MEKKIPSFVRQNYKVKKRVGSSWRKPRGIDNKQRIRKAGSTPMPRVGYRTPRKQRGLHSSGLAEVLVHNERDVARLEKAGQAARIAGSVGGKKRALMAKKAREIGVRVLN